MGSLLFDRFTLVAHVGIGVLLRHFCKPCFVITNGLLIDAIGHRAWSLFAATGSKRHPQDKYQYWKVFHPNFLLNYGESKGSEASVVFLPQLRIQR